MNVFLSLIAGLATAIPLVLKLVEYVRASVKEKNWNNLLRLVMDLMARAENKFSTGAERKDWVLSMVAASAKTINYDVDLKAVSILIDSLCDLTKVVNVEPKEVKA